LVLFVEYLTLLSLCRILMRLLRSLREESEQPVGIENFKGFEFRDDSSKSLVRQPPPDFMS